MATAPSVNDMNPVTGFTHEDMKQFVRDHFEQFVNQQKIEIAYRNFAPDFVDRGSDVPPGMPPGPEGAAQYVGGALKKIPDLRVVIEDIIAENDRVVVRNRWTGTELASGRKLHFSGIVIWRIAQRQLVERWAYLEPIRFET